jgi:hypothetical protein
MVAKREVDAFERLFGPATKQEDGDKDKKDSFEEAKRDLQNEMEEEIDGSEEAILDDDVSRKDSFYDNEEDGDKVAESRLPPATVGILLFIGVIVGLVVTWYTRKRQRRRSGLRKKLDV